RDARMRFGPGLLFRQAARGRGGARILEIAPALGVEKVAVASGAAPLSGNGECLVYASDERRMAAVGRVDSDAQYVERRPAKGGSREERGGKACAGTACPGDHRPRRKPGAAPRRPHAPMILRERDCAVGEGRKRTFAIEPGRGNE